MGTQQASFTDEQLATMMQAANDRKNSSSGNDAAPPGPPAPSPPPNVTPPDPGLPEPPPGHPVAPVTPQDLPDAPSDSPPGPISRFGQGLVAGHERMAQGALGVGKALLRTTPAGALLPDANAPTPNSPATGPEPAEPAPPPPQGASPAAPPGSITPGVNIHPAAPGAGGGVVIPGGMRPESQEREVKYGKQVAPGVREALGTAADLQMGAAGNEHLAGQQQIDMEKRAALMRMSANQVAADAQQRINEDAARITQDKMASIEALNAKAYQKPGDLWTAPEALGRVLGFVALFAGLVSVASNQRAGRVSAGMGLAQAGALVNSMVDSDIAKKEREKGDAAKAAGREINLLNLHKENLGDRTKAVQATKLAYYDNIVQQMDAWAADPKNQVNEARFNLLRASILDDRAKTANQLGIQEQSSVADKLVNKYRQPQATGVAGGAPQLVDHGNIVRLPNGTSYSTGSEDSA